MDPSTPSFSPGRKWSIGFNVFLSILAVLAVLAGINYLSQRHFFGRFYLSTSTRVELSPRTLALLRSLTNRVQVTLYYDKDEPLYSDIVTLLGEYQAHSSKLAVKSVDYYRDPGLAQETKLKYNLGSTTNKDFIIFDTAGHDPIIVDGNRLSSYRYDLQKGDDPADQKLYVNRKRTAFNGEMLFSSALFALSQPQALKAYFVLGHGEHSPEDTGDLGYSKVAEIFHRNYVQTAVTNLLGTNAIPLDCNLLVIAAPVTELSDPELEKVSQYLDQGGRMLMLFRASTKDRTTGLEDILAKWNVVVSPGYVRDPSASSSGLDLQIFDLRPHEITRSLAGLTLVLVNPHAVGLVKQASSTSTADEPHVTNLAFSGPNSYLSDDPTMRRHPYPLMVAIEKGAVKGVVSERGMTRLLVLGDSLCLDNQMIEVGANRDFADAAVNWLLDRSTLLQGIGPRPVAEYRLNLTRSQVQTLEIILLGGIPGGILAFGGLVWLRRRK